MQWKMGLVEGDLTYPLAGTDVRSILRSATVIVSAVWDVFPFWAALFFVFAETAGVLSILAPAILARALCTFDVDGV